MYKIYPKKNPSRKHLQISQSLVSSPSQVLCQNNQTWNCNWGQSLCSHQQKNTKYEILSIFKILWTYIEYIFFYLIQNSKIFAFQTHREKVPTTLSFENRAEDLIMEQKIWKQSSRFKNGAVDLKMEQKIWKWSRRFDNRAEDLKMEQKIWK